MLYGPRTGQEEGRELHAAHTIIPFHSDPMEKYFKPLLVATALVPRGERTFSFKWI